MLTLTLGCTLPTTILPSQYTVNVCVTFSNKSKSEVPGTSISTSSTLDKLKTGNFVYCAYKLCSVLFNQETKNGFGFWFAFSV